jgi:hypothetical protein
LYDQKGANPIEPHFFCNLIQTPHRSRRIQEAAVISTDNTDAIKIVYFNYCKLAANPKIFLFEAKRYGASTTSTGVKGCC